MASQFDKFVHEFDGIYYVCEWDSDTLQMKGVAPKHVGGWYVSKGYTKKSAEYVGRQYKSRKTALAAARRLYWTDILR